MQNQYFIIIILVFFACTIDEEDIDNEPPTISITSQFEDNIVTGNINIACEAIDNDEISKVILYINENDSAVIDSVSPYIFSLNTKIFQSGKRLRLKAMSVDMNKNISETDSMFLLPYNPKIVFESSRDTYSRVWIMDYDGQNPTMLTDDVEFEPEFSPDGSKIIIQSMKDHGAGDIWIMDIDGQNKSNLTYPYGHGCYNKSFSPDGLKIIYTSTRDQKNYIFSMELSTGIEQTLIEGIWTQSKPLYTSNGNTIIYSKYLSVEEGLDIFTIHVNTMDVTRLTHDPEMDIFLDVSSDGNTILFASRRTNNENNRRLLQDLFTMHTDGNNMTQLTSGYYCESAKFHPSNNYVVFCGLLEENQSFYLYRVNTDGSGLELIIDKYMFNYDVNQNYIIGSGSISGALEILKVNIDNSDIINLSNNIAMDSNSNIQPVIFDEF